MVFFAFQNAFSLRDEVLYTHQAKKYNFDFILTIFAYQIQMY